MPIQRLKSELPPAVRRIVDSVRRRIRAYVWVEGLALVVALLGGAFWLGLVLDWSFEPSPVVRQIGLFVLAIAGIYVAYRYLLRRVAVPISDSTVATLLERRFPILSEHVQTAVDISASPERSKPLHPDFIYQTQQSAAHSIANVHASELFNRGPLVRALGMAAALVLSIALFALFSRDAFAFWLERMALSNELWPRRVRLEVVGFAPDGTGQRVHKLARDDDFDLLVHAQTQGFELPDEVEIRFRLADGRRGRDTMIRVGDSQASDDDFQLFRYQFKRVAADMEFDVVGGDDRVRDLKLQVVERPELLAIELECIYPEYLDRAPRHLPVTGGMRIPDGTRLVLHAAATKPLTAARIHRAIDEQDVHLKFSDGPQDALRWEYGTLFNDDVLQVSVTDYDGVATREPYRLSLAVVRDEIPQVAVRLAGIGTAVTPDAMLPVVGKITDDYGMDHAWFEYQVDGAPAGTRNLSAQPAGEPLLSKIEPFDLRAVDERSGQRALELKPGQRFSLTLKASDRFDLLPPPATKAGDRTDAEPSEETHAQSPRTGSSQQFMLDVVTPSDLLALLERRELALRQRFEAIYEKMIDTRDVLGRVDFAEGEAEGKKEEEDSAPSASDPRSLARRRLRVSGSLQNVVQAADEVAGVAEGFDDLGEQLTNNRIDNPDLKSRLGEQIAQPLRRIADERMPQLAKQLKLLEQHVAEAATGEPELAKAKALADEILVEMRGVLDRMLELETYNEVVALLRDIITDQEEISRRTKQRQKERLRSLFED
jgi:hypothetical protein